MQLELLFDDCSLINNILVLNRRRSSDDIIMACVNSVFGVALPWRRSRCSFFDLNARFIFGGIYD